MKTFLLSLMMGLLILVVGCKKGPTIVGTWTTTMQGMTMEATYTDDNKFNATVSGDGGPMGPIKLSYSGTYTMKDGQMTSTVDKVDASSLPAQVRGMVEQQFKEQAAKSMTGKVTFKDNDTVTMEANGQTVEMKRKK